jgi:hypothetical protein
MPSASLSRLLTIGAKRTFVDAGSPFDDLLWRIHEEETHHSLGRQRWHPETADHPTLL